MFVEKATIILLLFEFILWDFYYKYYVAKMVEIQHNVVLDDQIKKILKRHRNKSHVTLL